MVWFHYHEHSLPRVRHVLRMRSYKVSVSVLDTIDTQTKSTRYRYRNEICGIAHH